MQGASTSLGMQSLARDLGWEWSLEVCTDASAAIGINRRRGLGKIRHLAAADFWVQDTLPAGDFTLSKVPGASNPADILTKYVERPTLSKHLDALGLICEEGRQDSAPMIERGVLQVCGLMQTASL